MKDRINVGTAKHPMHMPQVTGPETARQLPSKQALNSALRDMEQEGAPMDIVELAQEFGITVEQTEEILAASPSKGKRR